MKNSWVNFTDSTILIDNEELLFEPFDNNLTFFDIEDQGDYEWVFDGELLEDIESPAKDDFFLYTSGKTECVQTSCSLDFYAYQKYSNEKDIIIILKNNQEKYTILKNEDFTED